ncbi:GNAT family N-acetyltransferase [Noviherbaspirillum denitrificans]|uniref:Acetyltransferase n=1 Tax=Noviherbaspirillum denitrificans TaxID=1968433 RepID=A0A254T958_9BURK|nr:GNAT family protein [Noviherbaspirillum denitrificans]OWW19191.1 acetyltransferase [Noviherbaspirillum denitrificans]
MHLNAEGLCIRPFRAGDAEAFAAAVRESVATVGQWLPWCHSAYGAKEARVWIGQCAVRLNMGVSYDVGIFTEDDETLLGGVAINQIDHVHNAGNVGYWVRESMQRRGIGTRAARMIAKYGFDTLRLTRLEIVAAEHNHPSRAVAERLGARFECIARNRLFVRGAPLDAAVYSLIPGDI